MKSTFRWRASVTDPDTDEPLPVPADLDGWIYQEDRIENYLDAPLAEAGVIGGEIRAAVRDGEAELLIDFWHPDSMPAELLDLLRDNAVGQMSDGMGECGFVIDGANGTVLLQADEDGGVTLESVQDGRVIPGPSRVAIAARSSDLAALKQAIDDGAALDQPLQGFNGLHHAIGNRDLAATRLLLEAGADPNCPDMMGHFPIHSCALKQDVAAARELAELLLLHGADPHRPTAASLGGDGGELAVDFARIRGNTELVERLKRT